MPTKKAKRSDNRYMVNVTLGRDENGKRIRKYFYGDTQREANAKRDAFMKRHQEGLEESDDTLHAWIERWLPTSAQKESARSMYKLYSKKLDDALGDMNISEIRMIDINSFAQSVSGHSFSYMKKMKATTNRIFKDAVYNRIINYNPCEGVKWEYGSRGSHRALEGWEKALIVENHQVHRAGLWALLMLFAGLRRGEALALQWEDIDFEEGIVHVTKAIHFEGNKAVLSDTKTEAGIRDVPLLPQLKSCLEAYTDREGAVCRDAKNNAIDSQAAFKRGWESWLNAMENVLNGKKAYMPGRRTDLKDGSWRHFSVRTHDLRHTFCTMLYKAGVGLKEAQYIMGHADPTMTMEVYTHLDEESKRSAKNILQKYNEKLGTL